MAEPVPDIRIAGMIVRGRSLTAEQGRHLALAVARTLAAHHEPGTSLDRLTIRLPASVLRPDGSIAPAAIAIDRGGDDG